MTGPWRFVALMMLLTTGPAGGQSIDMDGLLEQVRQGRAEDRRINAERLATFKQEKARQQQRVNTLSKEKSTQEAKIAALEKQFEENRESLSTLATQRDERLGDLKELFGIIQQQVDDSRGQFETSLTHAQFPERARTMQTLSQKLRGGQALANMSDIENLWFELLREMRESANVVQFDAPVAGPGGTTRQQPVIRVGLFNAISNGRYLSFSSGNGQLSELPRQPPPPALRAAAGLGTGTEPYSRFTVDPSRGQLLSLLVLAPDLRERFHQGGLVGYVIVGLGALALLVAVLKFLQLQWLSARVRQQKKAPDQPRPNNPLGRVLGIFQQHPQLDIEALELKLSEAVLHEVPRIQRWVPSIKIIAAVAPLLGLLGTVIGMIVTFQSITLLGTGDPKLMADGISTALITTVLGLLVAIPALLSHSLVAAKAQQLSQVLEQQAIGIVAQQAEQQHSA